MEPRCSECKRAKTVQRVNNMPIMIKCSKLKVVRGAGAFCLDIALFIYKETQLVFSVKFT